MFLWFCRRVCQARSRGLRLGLSSRGRNGSGGNGSRQILDFR